MSGIFNVGTGKARSFRDLISAMFRALGREPNIEYVDMPENIRGQYQYFTQAEVENFRRAGYNAGFTPLEDAVGQYVTNFLDATTAIAEGRCSISRNSSPRSTSRRCSASAT